MISKKLKTLEFF